MIVLALLVALALPTGTGSTPQAQAFAFREEPVAIQSGTLTLTGTILAPVSPGRRPGVVLVHGAGAGPQAVLRREAEAFATAGIVTLLYDKRTHGYAATGFGPRSYALLADDALAAVRTLQARADVEPTAVGLWGLSEGAWVAPLAASRSHDVAFLMLVGAAGMPPAQQEAWRIEQQLRHQGVRGSLLAAMPHTFVRMLVAAELFPEARYDPLPVLERTHQPVLALWGELDQVAAPMESARLSQAALARGGNPHYTVRFIPGADHELRASPDGFRQRAAFAPGYVATVRAWVQQVARGEPPLAPASTFLHQDRPTPRGVLMIAWYESGGWLHLVMLLILVAAFGSYPLRVARRWRRPHGGPALGARANVAAWALAASGLASVIGLHGYLFVLLINNVRVGPVIAGRPLPWLMLQLLAVTTVALTMVLLWSGWARRANLPAPARSRLLPLLGGGLLVMPWGLYWGLLLP